MTKALNESDADMHAIDTLFADPLFDAATAAMETHASVEHASTEHSITSTTVWSLKNMLGRSPGRKSKNHRARLGRPETMEVRSLLSQNPVVSFTPEELAEIASAGPWQLTAEDRADIESLFRTTHDERVLASLVTDFRTISAGNLPDGKLITIPGIGDAKVYTGGSTPISVTADGGLQSGPNGGHLVLVFTKPTFVTSFTVQKMSGSGTSAYNTGTGYH